MEDIFDPNTWIIAPHECRIYGDDNAQLWSVVDEEDYQHCLQWKWSVKFSRGKRKFYLRRLLQVGNGAAARTRLTRFLHTEILLHAGILPPSPLHILVDHRDGDGMNCRRRNLRWATPSQNRMNIKGTYAQDFVHDLSDSELLPARSLEAPTEAFG